MAPNEAYGENEIRDKNEMESQTCVSIPIQAMRFTGTLGTIPIHESIQDNEEIICEV